MKDIKITRAGYLYIAGVKVNTRRLSPLYRGDDRIKNADVQVAVDKWIAKNWVMTNG